jgi:hypothetical protein
VEQQKNSLLMEMNDVKVAVEELTMEKVSTNVSDPRGRSFPTVTSYEFHFRN